MKGNELPASLRGYATRDKELLALWRDIVLLRDKRTCQVCRKPGNQAHHIFSRRHVSTRHDPENGICLCYFCHIRVAHEDPELFRDFLIKRMGESRFMTLKYRALTPSKIDFEGVFLVLDAEYKRLFREASHGRNKLETVSR